MLVGGSNCLFDVNKTFLSFLFSSIKRTHLNVLVCFTFSVNVAFLSLPAGQTQRRPVHLSSLYSIGIILSFGAREGAGASMVRTPSLVIIGRILSASTPFGSEYWRTYVRCCSPESDTSSCLANTYTEKQKIL